MRQSTTRFASAIILLIINDVCHGGFHYKRYPQSVITPTASSGLSNLTSLTIATLTGVTESAICVAQCNKNADCLTAQHQTSTSTCSLYRINPEGSYQVGLSSNADFTTFTLFELPTLSSMPKPPQLRSKMYETMLRNIWQSSCFYNSTTVCQDEDLTIDAYANSDLGYSMSPTSVVQNAPYGFLLKENPAFARMTGPITFTGISPTSDGTWWKIDLTRYAWISQMRYRWMGPYGARVIRLETSADDTNYNPVLTGSGMLLRIDSLGALYNVLKSINLFQPVFARFLRIVIDTNGDSNPTFRDLKYLIIGSTAMCTEPLGMESLEIEDSQLSISSLISSTQSFYFRLNWGLAKEPISGEVTVDLKKRALVTGFQLQGCKNINSWVTFFVVRLRRTPSDEWMEPLGNSIGGNSDSNSVKTYLFQRAYDVQFFQIIPIVFSSSNCYRFEILGCAAMPQYLPNLALGATVLSASVDSNALTKLSNAGAAAVTQPSRLIRENVIQNCTRFIASTNQTLLTIDLGANRSISSVEIVTPLLPPVVSLNPDGLWLLDMQHGADDLSTNANNGVCSQTLTWCDGVDGRKVGALCWPDTTITRSLYLTTKGIEIDLDNGWTFATWFYYQSASASIELFGNRIQNSQQAFQIVVSTDRKITLNKVRDNSSWSMNSDTALIPLNAWSFVGVAIDCRSGFVSIFINKVLVNMKYMECPTTSLPLSHYGWARGAFIGRLFCMQVYRRPLDVSEIEQASLCPWAAPAPLAIFPLNCDYADVTGVGLTFTPTGSPTCDKYMGFTSTAWSFPSASVHLNIAINSGPSSVLDLRHSFSMTLHVSFTAYGGNIVGWYSTAGTAVIVLKMNSAGCVEAWMACRGQSSANVTVEPVPCRSRLNRWGFYAVTYDYPSQSLRLFVEGRLVTMATLNCSTDGLATNQDNFRVGSNSFTGSIACLQLYRTALTQSHVAGLHTCPMTSAPSMKAAFNSPLDGSHGTTSQDDLSTLFNVLNMYTVTPGMPWTTQQYYVSRLNGTVGDAGSNMRATSVPNNMRVNGGSSFTISFFFRNLRAGSFETFFYVLDGAYVTTLIRSNNEIPAKIAFMVGASGERWIESPPLISQNIWYHLQASIDFPTGRMFVWVNGFRAVFSFQPSNLIAWGTSLIFIGRDTWGNLGFDGNIACFSRYQDFIESYVSQELTVNCPASSALQGHVCENHLTHLATFTMSSYLNSSGVAFLPNVIDSSTSGSVGCCWRPTAMDQDQWIQAYFSEQVTITQLAIQGDATSPGFYISQFSLKYSFTGNDWIDYIDRATDTIKVFWGSYDATAVNWKFLRPYIVTRFLRLLPTTWGPNGIGLRLAIRGCSSFLCNIELFAADPALSVTASSGSNLAHANRHNFESSIDWIPSASDAQPYFEIYFSHSPKIVTEIGVMSSVNQTGSITKYHLTYINEGLTSNAKWRSYTWYHNGSRIRIFDGPPATPFSAVRWSYLNPPLVARAVRLYVDEFSTKAIGRFSFKGCNYLADDERPIRHDWKIRIGSNAPADLIAAEAQTPCGPSSGIGTVAYASRLSIPCQPVASGRYLSIFYPAEKFGAEFTVCKVNAYYLQATNFAFGKVTSGSVDIAPAELGSLLTDGSLTTGQALMNPDVYNWIAVDLGFTMTISKVSVVLSPAGSWDASTRSVRYQIRVGDNMIQVLSNAICDFYRAENVVRGQEMAFHCTPPLRGRRVILENLYSGFPVRLAEIMAF